MKRLTLLVDMDDTIEDLLGAQITYLNNKHSTNVGKDDITRWDISAAFPSLSKQQVYKPIRLDNFWKTVKPKDGAYDALEKMLADGNTIYIVTASTHETLHTKK